MIKKTNLRNPVGNLEKCLRIKKIEMIVIFDEMDPAKFLKAVKEA